MDTIDTNQHNVYIVDRSCVELSGINDVIGFTDSIVEAEYNGGNIAIEGGELKIVDFSSQTGVLKVVGVINAVYYFGTASKRRKGLFSR